MSISTPRVLMIGGATALVFNGLFPRAADPWDQGAVLMMIADNSTRRQVAFVGVTVAVLLIAGSVIRLGWEAGVAGWWGSLLTGVGCVLFTAASALGLAVTGVARSWVQGGGRADSVDFAVGAALNRADDFVWFVSIAALWFGFGLVGLSLRKASDTPRWAGPILAVLGFTTALVVGLPLAVGVEWLPLVIGFGVLAVLTAVWAIAVGLRMAATARST